MRAKGIVDDDSTFDDFWSREDLINTILRLMAHMMPTDVKTSLFGKPYMSDQDFFFHCRLTEENKAFLELKGNVIR